MIMAVKEDFNSRDIDIGIIGIESYFPRYFVDQNELGKQKYSVFMCNY